MTMGRAITKAVIPAAGLGTRFLPATKAMPKEMLPVVDRPAIQYVVVEAIDAGLSDLLMITGRNKRALEDHFDREPGLEAALEAKGDKDKLGLVEYAVEDTPQLPDDWTGETVPLASLVRGHGTTPTRLVVFRRPIEHRCDTRADLEAMVLTVLVEQVAELLGMDPEDVDPRYSRDDEL